MKKAVSVLLALVMCFSLIVTGFSAESKTIKEYLLLGDSISEGYGIKNRDQACYGKIIADTNGWGYTNHGRSAKTSDQLLEDIESGEITEDIKKADLISISIGGNDYLNDSGVVGVALGALLDIDTPHINELTEHLRGNFRSIMKDIRAINPDAVIFLQHVPCTWFGVLGIAYGRITAKVSKLVDEIAAEFPENVYVLDVAGVIDGNKEYVANDTIHPNVAGNVAIAKLFQAKLYELGYVSSPEIKIVTPGIDYDEDNNYFIRLYGEFPGRLFYYLVIFFTGNIK